jgi:hypothetical protein
VIHKLINKFHDISINGRFIYGYLCLRKAIDKTGAEHLPDILLEMIYEFVSSNNLDSWQQRADEVLPSTVMDEINGEDYYKFLNMETVIVYRKYYKNQPILIKELIEELLTLGMANLYCGFDSNITYPHVEEIIKLMEDHKIQLPEFSIIEHCSVGERHGWGEGVNMSDFIQQG